MSMLYYPNDNVLQALADGWQ